MRRVILFALLQLMTVATFAYDFKSNGICYNVIADGMVEVTSNPDNSYSGDSPDNSYSGDIYIPSTVMSDSVLYHVTAIGNEAFADCESLSSINIPSGVTSIGIGSFVCCSSLTSLVLPDGLTSIGISAFVACTNLASINIPSGVTSIEGSVFAQCSSLTSIVLPDGVTSIGDYAFYGCSALTSIVLPAGITSIGEEAFAECFALADVTNLADTPQQITEDVFSNYDATLHVNNGLKQLYASAPVWRHFYQIIDDANGDPTPAELPDNFFYDGLYYNKVSETTVEVAPVPEGVAKYSGAIVIPERAIYEGIEAVVVGIGDNAFSGCTNLASIDIPWSVTSFGNEALRGCNKLTYVMWNADNVVVPEDLMCNPNVIIYATENYHGDAMRENLVKGDMAEKLVLHDGYDLGIPQPFWAKHAEYIRTFTKQTQMGTSAGWETIVLPFDVTNFVSEKQGRVAPFGSEEATDKHFYLARLANNGFEMTSEMQANIPYIISMPNSPVYADQYNIDGRVMFYAEASSGIYVSATEEAAEGYGPAFNLIPSYESMPAAPNIYVLNDEEYDGMLPGSVFVPNKDVEAFRPYVKDITGYAPAYIPVFEGDVTAIMPIFDVKPSRTDDAVYDLMGIRQNPNHLQKGKAYIVKGSKRFLKRL